MDSVPETPDGSRVLDVIDIARIMHLIPHRYPFLLIDRVVDVVLGERATGIKNVTINENFFQGHFPHHPVMPGVLIIESMAQTAAVLVVETLGRSWPVRWCISCRSRARSSAAPWCPAISFESTWSRSATAGMSGSFTRSRG